MKKAVISLILICSLCPQIVYLQTQTTDQKRRDNQRYRLAKQYENAGRFTEALRIFEQIWDSNPASISYYRGVKNCLVNLKRYREAITVVEKMLSVRRDYYIESDLGDIYYKMGQPEKAQSIWNDIINRYRGNPATYQAIANSMLGNRLFDDAIKVYEKGRENIPNNTIFLIELANLYGMRLDYKNATLMYLEYLNRIPKQYEYVENQLIRLAKRIEEVEPIIQILRKKNKNEYKTVALSKLIAQLYIQDSNYGQALKEYRMIDDVMSAMSDKDKNEWGKELFIFAQNALNDGAFGFSEQAYRIVISKYSKNSAYVTSSYYGLAESAFLQGKYSEALSSYNSLIKSFPKTVDARRAFLRIGDIYLDYFNKPDSAKVAYESILKKFPFSNDHFDAYFKIADCEIVSDKLQAAEAIYKRILKLRNKNDVNVEKARYYMALVKFWTYEFDVSLEYLDVILNVLPIFRGYKNGRFVNDALELKMIITENKAQPEILKEYASALKLSRQKKYAAALARLEKILKANPQTSLAERTMFEIGELEIQLSNYNEAIHVYRKIITDYPDGLLQDVAQKRIGDIYRNYLNDNKKAIKEYELVLTNHPQSLLIEEVRKTIRKMENN